jgi:hypothetical protein
VVDAGNRSLLELAARVRNSRNLGTRKTARVSLGEVWVECGKVHTAEPSRETLRRRSEGHVSGSNHLGTKLKRQPGSRFAKVTPEVRLWADVSWSTDFDVTLRAPLGSFFPELLI